MLLGRHLLVGCAQPPQARDRGLALSLGGVPVQQAAPRTLALPAALASSLAAGLPVRTLVFPSSVLPSSTGSPSTFTGK